MSTAEHPEKMNAQIMKIGHPFVRFWRIPRSVNQNRKYVCKLTLLLFVSVVLGAPAIVHAQDKSLYTVARLSIDMQAADAVTAKAKALASAKRQALATVLRRIAPFNSGEQLPQLSDKDIDNMVQGFAVQRERNSPTRYLATLDFTFDAQAVRSLLAEKGIPLSDQQADMISVLPLYVTNGKIDHSGRDPWRAAWNALDLTHAVVPVKLVRAGPSLTLESLSGILGGDPKAFVELRDKVKAEKLILAIAEPTADVNAFTSQLFGFDRVGAIGLKRHDTVVAGDLQAAATYAASISQQVLDGRWKLLQSPSSAGGEGQAVAFDLFVEFSGMSQWKDMRSRLTKVPGVNGLDVKSLSARSAQIGLQYPGGAENLANAVGAQGLTLDGSIGNAWVLRSN